MIVLVRLEYRATMRDRNRPILPAGTFDMLLKARSCSMVSPWLTYYEPVGFCPDRATRASGVSSC